MSTSAPAPCCFLPEAVHEAVELYCLDVPIEDIASWTSLIPDDVNMILDHYAPYL